MATIFTFSSTGNSLYVSKQIAKSLKAEISFMSQKTIECDDDIIGFVFPTFFFELPKTVESFIKSINIKNKDAYIFSVITYGDNIFGANGIVNKILQSKGLNLSYNTQIKMVENYLPMYEINNTPSVQEQSEKEIVQVCKDISEKTTNKVRAQSFLDKLIYLKYPARKNGKCDSLFTVDGCSKCGTCVKMCPRGNIKMTDKGIEFTGNCELCLGCVHSCPQKAINWNNKTQGKERYLNPNIKRSELIDLIQKSK